MKKIVVIMAILAIMMVSLFFYPTVNIEHLPEKNVVTKSDYCVKTKFTWEDSHGNLFPVYMTNKGSCFVIRTSKSGENYRSYLGKEVSEQIRKELSKSTDTVLKTKLSKNKKRQ